MPTFSHQGYFPFCIKTVESASSENTRYNNFYGGGFTGVGSIYPVGMPLVDAMALYWRLRYITWDFSATWVDSGRISVGPYYPIGDPQTTVTPYQIFRIRGCGDIEAGGERYNISLNGPIRYYSPFSDENTNESPMNCFFAPCSGDQDPDCGSTEKERDFARIIYSEATGLYYPSIFVFYWGYSRLYCNQKFISGDYSSTTYEPVPMSLNGNTYQIPLLQVFNYTSDPPWDGGVTGEIECFLVS